MGDLAYFGGVAIGFAIQIAAWWRLGRLLGFDLDSGVWKRWRWLVVAYLWWIGIMWVIGAADIDHPAIDTVVGMWLPIMLGSWVLGIWELVAWVRGLRRSSNPSSVKENDQNGGEQPPVS